MAAAALQPPCQASWDPWRQSIAPQPVRHLAQRGGDIGEDAAAEQARRATGGRVLSVRKGKRSYRVKVLLPQRGFVFDDQDAHEKINRWPR